MKIILIIIPFFILSCAYLPETPVKKIEVSNEREDIRKAIRRYFSIFRDCYMVEFEKKPQVQGDMTFAWEIHKDGIAKNIIVIPNPTSLKSDALEQCLVKTIARIKFPEPELNTILIVKDYFFRFSGRDNKTYIEATY